MSRNRETSGKTGNHQPLCTAFYHVALPSGLADLTTSHFARGGIDVHQDLRPAWGGLWFEATPGRAESRLPLRTIVSWAVPTENGAVTDRTRYPPGRAPEMNKTSAAFIVVAAIAGSLAATPVS